jgi:hexokinase
MIQEKVKVPEDFMISKTSKSLFNFIAKSLEKFLRKHYPEPLLPTGSMPGEKMPDEHVFNLGFTFSHAVKQLDINSGTLIRWSKGFDIDGVVGQDVCALLENELRELKLPVRVTALINDTVGTLMARAYASPNSAYTIMGAVFGTGSNGAYIEKRSKVSKLPGNETALGFHGSDSLMIINTEWGNFDQKLKFLPNTSYDIAVDAGSINPGIEMFEKRISGMYLGEILRLVILSLIKDPLVPIFSHSSMPETSQLYTQWGIDSEFLSLVKGDASNDFCHTRGQIEKWMGITNATYEDASAVRIISHAIGRRSARLSAIALGAVILQTDSLKTCSLSERSTIDIGVDGSLIEFYPGYVEEVRAALRDIERIGTEGEAKIVIAIAKDGSGVGAALTAHIASKIISAQP